MAKDIKILVVDDEVTVGTSIANALISETIDVETVLSAEEAFKKDLKDFNIVITDLMMPGISGMDLLKKLKEEEIEAEVIMITGYPSVKSAVESIKIGAFDYLPKPFTPKELRSVVQRAIEKHKVSFKTKIPHISPPAGLYCIPSNVWVKLENDQTVTVGAHHILLNSISKIISVEFPKINETRFQGEALVVINDANHNMHRIWNPVAGKIIALNDEIQKDLSLLYNDPYEKGWLLRVMPTHLNDDMKNLVPLD